HPAAVAGRAEVLPRADGFADARRGAALVPPARLVVAAARAAAPAPEEGVATALLAVAGGAALEGLQAAVRVLGTRGGGRVERRAGGDETAHQPGGACERTRNHRFEAGRGAH